jgi:hypothetical protein
MAGMVTPGAYRGTNISSVAEARVGLGVPGCDAAPGFCNLIGAHLGNQIRDSL